MASEGKDDHFDFLVIGGGSGAMGAARRSAAHGAKVCLIERARLGGTCVNVGCVPKKAMWNTSAIMEAVHTAERYGITAGEPVLDWAKCKEARDFYVKRLNGIYEGNLKGSGITFIQGSASFVGPKTVKVNDRTLTADHILIAVGGRPATATECGVKGGEHTITSDGFFELEAQPKRVAVVGAGYIAVELAGVMRGLGSEVTLYSRYPSVLRTFDELMQSEVLHHMGKQGIKHCGGGVPTEVRKDEATGELTCVVKGEDTGPFDCVIFAAGRVIQTDDLNLGSVGVEVVKKGHSEIIKVDDDSNTTAPGIYSVGDCIGKIDLTPVALAAGRLLGDRLFGGKPTARMDYDMVPSVVFSHPPIGTCGLTEAAAVAKHGEDKIKVYTSTWWNLTYGQWKCDRDLKPRSKAKLVCLLPSERVIGLHVIGMGADEMVQGFGVAMKLGATKVDFDSCVAIHPTASEELVTMAPWTHRSLHSHERDTAAEDAEAAAKGGAGAAASAL